MLQLPKTAEIMFETYSVPALSLTVPSVLALLAHGRANTGVVLDCGHSATRVTPIHQGRVVIDGIGLSDIGGQHVTEEVMRMLNDETGGGFGRAKVTFYTSAERECAQEAKHKLGYVALHFDTDADKSEPQMFTLPDGNSIPVHPLTLCKGPEALFNPKDGSPGVHRMIHSSMLACGVEAREEMRENVVVCGGGSFLHGFEARLRREMGVLTPTPVSILVSPERQYMAWIGGSFAVEMSSFRRLCVGKDEYEDEGARVVYRKCL